MNTAIDRTLEGGAVRTKGICGLSGQPVCLPRLQELPNTQLQICEGWWALAKFSITCAEVPTYYPGMIAVNSSLKEHLLRVISKLYRIPPLMATL